MASEAIPIPPDENRGPEILAICGTLVALSVIIVTLRIWVRARIIRQVGIDDWTIIAATVTIFVEMMIIIPEVYYGAGRHVQYIDPPSNIVKGLHLNFVTQPLCLIALCFTKVSVGFFLLRITPSQKFRWFIIGTIIFTILSATGNFCMSFPSAPCPPAPALSKRGKEKKRRKRKRVVSMNGDECNELTFLLSSDRLLPMSAPSLHVGRCHRRKMYGASQPQIRRLLQLQRRRPD